MNYKDLLVYLDESKSCDNRINAAIELAQTHEAHLTGLCVAIEPQLPGYVKAHMAADILAQQEEQARKRAEELAEKFTQKVKEARLTVDCRIESCLEPNLPRLISTHARYADLVVLGQPDPAEDLPGGVHLLAEVTLSAGRPALIVPFIGTRTALGEQVMVAWDAGRESTRAVNDALPFLERARSVVILVVNPKSGSDRHGEQPGADIALHLTRHGCKVEAQHIESGDVSVGDMILSRLADQSTDLLVMGAYSHARLRELILGGVTQTIMKHMTVPVLMSH